MKEQQIKTINRAQLFEQVWSKPMIKLAQEYGLSDNGLRKICRKFEIPIPEGGYWQKLQYGKPVKKQSLPILDGEDKIEIRESKKIVLPLEFETQLNLKDKINVSDRLVNPHRLITLAKEDKKENARENYSHKRRGITVRVTNKNFDRALRIMDTLIKALEQRGCEVSPNDDNYSFPIGIHVCGEKVDIDLYETERKIHKEKRNTFDSDYELISTGKLILRIDHYWGMRTQWRDGDVQKIEDLLDGFIEGIFHVAAKEKELRVEREKEVKEQKERSRLLEELRALKEAETKRVNALFEDASGWQKSKIIRAFIEAKKEAYNQQHGAIESGCEFEKWLVWANNQADRVDPLKESPLSILDEKEPKEIW